MHYTIRVSRNLRRVAVITLMLGFFDTLPASFVLAKQWLQFKSSVHFSVDYPASWYRLADAAQPYRMDLLDAENGGQEAVLVAPGHATIVVMEEDRKKIRTLDSAVARYLSDAKGAVKRISLVVPPGPDHCQSLTELVVRYEVVSAEDIIPRRTPHQIGTEFLCEAPGRVVTVDLINWEGDKRQAIYQDVALHMAQSLRLMN